MAGKIDQCLNPNCRKKSKVTRGLCSVCYNTARLLVKNGTYTWEQLIKSGRALEKSPNRVRPPSKRQTWFILDEEEEKDNG